MQKVRKAVLTDAGYATRFLPITKTIPKSMLPILDKPIIHYIVEECMQAGITEVIVVATEEGKSMINDYFNNTVEHIYKQLIKQNKESRLKKISDVFTLPNVVVITQDRHLPYGNGTPMLSAKTYIGDEPFIYIYTDDLILGESGVKDLVEAFEENNGEHSVIGVADRPEMDLSLYGIAKLKRKTSFLDYIVEKPKKGKAPSSLISMGRYLFTPHIFKHIKPTEENLGKDNELWTADAVDRLNKEKPVVVKVLSGEWVTTGDPDSYLETCNKVASMQKS
jgi:UTP--glucose-1-phosphate uridylyltransferase